MHGAAPEIHGSSAPQNLPPPRMRAMRVGLKVPKDKRIAGKLAAEAALAREEIAKATAELEAAGLVAEFGKPTKKPEKLTFTDGEIRALESELTHLEHLVAPYGIKADGQPENIVRYLHSFGSTMELVERSVHQSSRLLTVDSPRLAAAKPYQARVATIEAEFARRKQEIFGESTSLFHGKSVITFDEQGNQRSRIIKKIEYRDTFKDGPKEIYLDFEDGSCAPISRLQKLLQQPIRYGPDNQDNESINQYIRYCFNPNGSLIDAITHQGDDTVITLKTKSGRKWSLRCRVQTNKKARFGRPELVIQNVRNWQVIIPDHLLDTYTDDCVTKGSMAGLIGYIARDEHFNDSEAENFGKKPKPKTWLEKLEAKANSIWESGVRIFNKWERGSRMLHRLLK